LVIPREGPRAEQKMRSRIFADRGLVDVLYPNELSSTKVAARIVANLEQTDSRNHNAASIDTGGANYVARLLAERTREVAKRRRVGDAVSNGATDAVRPPLASIAQADTW
jgi:predicted glycosyltransferase